MNDLLVVLAPNHFLIATAAFLRLLPELGDSAAPLEHLREPGLRSHPPHVPHVPNAQPR